ncbi:hypothetical protein MNBD_ACTINO01-181 [hydrothermal vent metagenome]|uniref:Uncharacterized protein n=1 Tax=hydrothermal vent metagenome TaxID=652676 RepID=A0A3B0RXF8_9ZZZZ
MQRVIERILNLLAFLLTVGRPVTADEIRYTVKGYDQETDEAFRRTFERDKDLLRSLGVPLVLAHTDVWEVELGYEVPSDEYSIDDPGLSDEERSALLLAAQAVRFGGQPTELAAIFKLGGARRSNDSGMLYADLGHDLEVLGSLYDAVTRHRITSFTYRERQRTVEPYGLVHRFGHWYLAAQERGTEQPVKAFRVDRMTALAIDEHPGAFARPEGFHAKDALGSFSPDTGTGDRALVRFDSDVAQVALSRFAGAREVASDASSVLVEVPMTTQRSVIGWVLGFDDRAVIESPPELRDAFIDFVGGRT